MAQHLEMLAFPAIYIDNHHLRPQDGFLPLSSSADGNRHGISPTCRGNLSIQPRCIVFTDCSGALVTYSSFERHFVTHCTDVQGVSSCNLCGPPWKLIVRLKIMKKSHINIYVLSVFVCEI